MKWRGFVSASFITVFSSRRGGVVERAFRQPLMAEGKALSPGLLNKGLQPFGSAHWAPHLQPGTPARRGSRGTQV